MAIFDFNNFNHRTVVKLAPDAFVTINGALGGRIVTSLNKNGTQDVDLQGGIISINANSTITSPGAGKASIQIVAPDYAGVHSRDSSNSSGYWVTLPSGVKVPYIIPMMEVQIFMKGRYLVNQQGINNPIYYRVFWGFITDVTEEYHDGVNTLSVQCNDMLWWWNYQKLNVSPNEWSASVGGPSINKFSTILKGMNPWDIIKTLTYETQWSTDDGSATYAFIQTKRSSYANLPKFGNLPVELIGSLAIKMNEYWNKRFNFFGESLQIEMFGLTNRINIYKDPQSDAISGSTNDSSKSNVAAGSTEASLKYNPKSKPIDPNISLDYNLLARVQPFSDIDLFAAGSESLEMSKLDIAKKVCDASKMEFYLDTNGIIVFKPPFYNMDVTKGNINYYVIDPSDVLNFSSGINADAICTYLELTAPASQNLPNHTEVLQGLHIDWDLLLRYGLRYQKGNVQYGNDATSLSLIAAAEMTRMNSEATTGHVSIPIRPELRMGYPIYLTHKDVYFYVTGITHSFNFGSGATTDLSLTAKRERIYDFTGELTSDLPIQVNTSDNSAVTSSTITGRVLRGFVQKFVEKNEFINDTTSNPSLHNADKEAKKLQDVIDPAAAKMYSDKEDHLRLTGVMAGPKFNGAYKLVPAALTGTSLDGTTQNPDISNATGDKSTVMSNQMLMITKDTIPYTDYRGYRHIGAFPYGANLILKDSVTLGPLNDSVTSKLDNQADAVTNTSKISGAATGTPTTPNEVNTQTKTDGRPVNWTYGFQQNTPNNTSGNSFTYYNTATALVIADKKSPFAPPPAGATNINGAYIINPNGTVNNTYVWPNGGR
jgi:hypothetical protein